MCIYRSWISADQSSSTGLDSVNLRHIDRRPTETSRKFVAIEVLSLGRRDGAKGVTRWTRCLAEASKGAVLLSLLAVS